MPKVACASHERDGIVNAMNEFRELRRRIGLAQEGFAALLGVSAESCRAWDSGRRTVPSIMLLLARRRVSEHVKDHEWLTLQQLARDIGVNVHTLRSPARSGRLKVQFRTRSVFGRPVRRATRAAGREFLSTAFGKGPEEFHLQAPLVLVPTDYAEQLRSLRKRLHLTQEALGHKIGAAGKAVIYQWESGKRTPSPVLCEQIERVQSKPNHPRQAR
jgi:DNA-binding transcriptional regulator YiaG